MSGIVGSRFNIRGSGLVGSLGTDGQVFTSSGAGKSAVYEAAAGGKVGQIVWDDLASSYTTTSSSYADTGLSIAITPSASSSYIWVMVTFDVQAYGNNSVNVPDGDIQITDGSNTELATSRLRIYHGATNRDSGWAGAIGAYYTTGGTSAETIKVRTKARGGRIAIYATAEHKNTTTLTAMEILA
jgi:hypothetical protein